MSKQVGDAQIIAGNCVRLDINFRISGDGWCSQDGEIVAIYAQQDRDVAIEGGKVTSGASKGQRKCASNSARLAAVAPAASIKYRRTAILLSGFAWVIAMARARRAFLVMLETSLF
ncbi:hypothetical protein [Rhizobium phaseoli]|uniref:hypothetical protein n=1 Tax=Rhizobium phaseoli TaxID=396 RepID=UPI0003703A3C|nr:hypothetical protein [Rhizobium phaseoli]